MMDKYDEALRAALDWMAVTQDVADAHAEFMSAVPHQAVARQTAWKSAQAEEKRMRDAFFAALEPR